MPDLSQETATTERANLQAACDRICGVSDYHEDECPLYQQRREFLMPDETAATTGGPLSAERLAAIEACLGTNCWGRDAQRQMRVLLAEVRRLSEENGQLRERIEAECCKFQAETLRTARIFDALDHWRFIADQEWSSDPHKVLRDCIAEARAAGDHLTPYGPGHDSTACHSRRVLSSGVPGEPK
jgi:hypothetical protein